MAILQLLFSITILTIFYVRMIKRETPSIKKAQAIVPVIFGVISLVLSLFISFGLTFVLSYFGWSKNNIDNLVLKSIFSAFFGAGFPEEIAKFLFIMLSILIFKPKNVYEYLLVGFGVGMGFTIFEEFLYSSNLIALITRLLIITFHAVCGSIMGSYIGKAKYYKLNKVENKSPILEYLKALIIPILIHTIYDASNVKNAGLEPNIPDRAQGIAVIIAIVVILSSFIMQIIVHIKIKKDAEKLCMMAT